MGRRTVERSYWKRKKLSCDAKIIKALLEKQPLSAEELWKRARVPRSTFYTIIPLLERSKMMKSVDGKYALWTFDDVQNDIQTELEKIKERTRVSKKRLPNGIETIIAEGQPSGVRTSMTTHDLALAVGWPWEDIKTKVYAYARAHGFMITDDGLIYRR